MNEQRSGAIIDGRGRHIILNVNKYFEEEKEQCRMLLLRMTSLTYDKKEVRVPMPIFADVVNHLRSAFQVTKRVAAATCINKNSLTRIKREGAAAKDTNTSINTPKKRPRGKKNYFNQDELNQLESILNSFKSKNQDFSFKMLMSVVKRDLNYTGSLATLRRIIQDMGFHWKKQPGSTLVTFVDDSNICTDLNTEKNMEDNLENNKKSCCEYEEYLDEDNLQSEDNDCPEDTRNHEENHNPQTTNHNHDSENQEPMPPMFKEINSIAIVNNTESPAQDMRTNELDINDVEYLLEDTDDVVNFCNSNNISHSQSAENSSSSFAILQYLKLDPTIDFFKGDLGVDEDVIDII